MSEYPEHIDQIDDFYRSQLADHEIEPPAGLWEKISASAFEMQSPEAHATITSGTGSGSIPTLFLSTKKLIGIGATALLIVAGACYWYTNHEQGKTESEMPPVIEQPAEGSQDSAGSPETGDKEQVISPSHSSSSTKDNTPASGTHTEEEPVIIPEVSEEPSNQTPPEHAPIVVPESQKADSLAEIKTTPKAAPKEKVKFKDKYKKDYQDSTRKIFVPGK